jgi:acetyl-CoA carboxylase, biotin carboxyl carrier protein
MEIENLLKLINEVSKSGLTEFKYEENGVKVSLKSQQEIVTVQAPVAAIPMEARAVTGMQGAVSQTAGAGAVASDTVVAEMTSADAAISDANTVKAPLVGTFYAAPSEGAKPFAQVGDVVKKGQVLGIIEAMKLMNEIECEVDGTIEEVLVKNQEMVEYGQPLFRII